MDYLDNKIKLLLLKDKNYLIVEEGKGPSTDNSVVQITQKKMDELKLEKSETVILKGRKRKQLVLILLPDDSNSLSDNKVRLNEVSRNNLGVKKGDFITINTYRTLPFLNIVKILPIEETIKGISGDLAKDYLIPYFKDSFRPITKSEIFKCKKNENIVEFQIVESDQNFGIVAPQTIIFNEGDPIKREDIKRNEGVGYNDFGGYKNQIFSLFNLIVSSLDHIELYNNLGIKHAKGILIYGPHGTGKTLLTNVISNEIDCFSFILNGYEIMSKSFEEAKHDLNLAFAEIIKGCPSILIIDNIDVISKKSKIKSEFEKKILSLLIYLMDTLRPKNRIIVIGTATNIEDIDPLLRTNDKFYKEIEIGIPDVNERLEILKIHTEKMKLDEEIKLKNIALMTENFVGADLAQICNDAGYQCMMEKTKDIGLNGITKEILDSMKITKQNFISAIEQKKAKLKKENLKSTDSNCDTDLSWNFNV